MTASSTAVVIIGAGAQAKYACETFLLQDVDVLRVVDLEQEPGISWPGHYDCEVSGMGELPAIQSQYGNDAHYIVCIADQLQKKALSEQLRSSGLRLASAIHPASVIASSAVIGEGVVINAGAVIQPFARIGNGVMVHANCIVEHDVVLENYVNLAPGVKLAGWVKIGEGATVFTGANVIPGTSIGEGAVVAAGATVIRDVAAGTLVAGCPASQKRNLQ